MKSNVLTFPNNYSPSDVEEVNPMNWESTPHSKQLPFYGNVVLPEPYIDSSKLRQESLNNMHKIHKGLFFDYRSITSVEPTKEVNSMPDNTEIDRLHSDIQEIRKETKEDYVRIETKIDSKFDFIGAKIDSKFDNINIQFDKIGDTLHSLDKRVAIIEQNTDTKEQKRKIFWERFFTFIITALSIVAVSVIIALINSYFA